MDNVILTISNFVKPVKISLSHTTHYVSKYRFDDIVNTESAFRNFALNMQLRKENIIRNELYFMLHLIQLLTIECVSVSLFMCCNGPYGSNLLFGWCPTELYEL